MKGQQLFHSFLPGVTVAVLSTQPAWAGTVKVSRVQTATSGSVLTANYGQPLVADVTNTQIYTTDRKFKSLVPASNGTLLNVKPLSDRTIPIIGSGNNSSIKAQILRVNQSSFYSLSSTAHPAQKPDIKSFADSNQKQNNSATTGQKLENIVVPTSNSKLPAIQNKNLLVSSFQQPTTNKQTPQTQLQTVPLAAISNPGTAKQLLIPNCSQQNLTDKTVSQAYLQLNSGAGCAQSMTTRDLIAQSITQTTPATTTPAPTGTVTTQTVPRTTIPASTGTVTTQTVPGTTIPALTGTVQVPENLIPNPNPLQYPTKPEEVTLQRNQPITLAQALELARRNNRELQVAQLELERSRAALREAQANLYPTVGISSDITRQRSVGETLGAKQAQQAQENVPPEFREPVASAPSTTSFSAQAQLTYDLYTSGLNSARRREAEEQVRLSELAVENQSEDIRLNVSTEYYDLQQADEQVRIAQSAVTNAQASLRDAEALERAGVGTRFDVLRSQVNLANSQQDLTNAISQQQIARRRLATRLSLPQSVNISAADPVKIAGLWNQTLEQSIILALQNRPDLQQLLVQRNIGEQQRRQALAGLGPQVSLVASYSFLDQFNDNLSVADGYSVGVRASLNLFDGGASRARAAQARANIAIAETQFAEQRNQIRFQVEQAYSNQQSNLENVQTANTALEQAREALRLARLRFQAGVGTQTDVINSENDLTRAEGNRVRAILDYNRALAQLQRSVTLRAFR